MRLIGAIALGFLGGLVLGMTPQWKPLTAQYLLSSSTIIDPGPDEPIELLLLDVTGESAIEIFNAMSDPGGDVECDGSRTPGLVRKVAKHFECSQAPNRPTSCTVGISLRTGETRRGYVCD